MSDGEGAGAGLRRLGEAATALEELGRVLGLGPYFLAGESRDHLVFEGVVHAAALTRVPAVAAGLRSLGGALTALIKVRDLTALEIGSETSKQDVDDVRGDLEGQDVRLDLQVHKDVLRQQLGLEHPDAEVALFLSPEALVRELRRPLPEVERNLLHWDREDRKLIILVAGCSVVLSGEHLAVVGSSSAEGWDAAVPREPPATTRILALREQALLPATGPGTVNWLRFELRQLTPGHLAIDEDAAEAGTRQGGRILRSVQRLQSLLSIVYTANQVTAPSPAAVARAGGGGRGGDWVASYAGEGRVARISWRDGEAEAGEPAGDGRESGARSLCEMAQWAYEAEPASADHLTVVRDVIARDLIGNDPEVNFRLLVGQAGVFWERVMSSWQAFIGGRLDRYFGRVRELEQVVDASVKAATEQLDGLTKALGDNALAAVGVIVGAFLAAVFKDKFDPAVYRLAVGAYVVYLLVFPGAFGLTASWQRFRALARGFEQKRQGFAHRLSEDEVNEVAGRGFREAAQRYWIWFVVAAMVYLTLGGLLWWSRSEVPRIVAGMAQAPAAAAPAGKAAPPATRP